MRSNYRAIGDYIRLVDNRNSSLKKLPLIGVSINKKFIPSVANIIGTNMKTYKLIRKNQFACSLMQVRRDRKIPVALFEDEEAIISQAYPVFEIKDITELLPAYLMMWMSRSEFDREACFYAVGGVRGSLEWEDFCAMQLPIPSLEKQREIVKEYQAITDRIKLNEQLNQKLEDTAQSIYKEWFVNFEFPDENGKPYKSNGGEMEYSDELDMEIPKGWNIVPYTNIIDLKGGGTPSTEITEYWDGDIPFFTPKDVTNSIYSVKTEKNITQLGFKKSSTKIYPKNTVFVTARGTVGSVAMSSKNMAMNQSCYAAVGKNINQFFVYQHTKKILHRLKSHAVGGVFGALVTRDFDYYNVIKPNELIIEEYGQLCSCIHNYVLIKQLENDKLEEMKMTLFSKMATIKG